MFPRMAKKAKINKLKANLAEFEPLSPELLFPPVVGNGVTVVSPEHEATQVLSAMQSAQAPDTNFLP